MTAMFKLYYHPNSLAFSVHIALEELGLPYQLVAVDHANMVCGEGQPYLTIHPMGTVPALRLEDGQVLTESTAILAYLADLQPARQLAPARGDFAYYRLLEWMNFVSAEIHQCYLRFTIPNAPADVATHAVQRLQRRYGRVDQVLQDGRAYLLGDVFTVADALLYSTVRWCPLVGLDTAQWSALQAWMGRVGQRPAVVAALAAEERAGGKAP